MREHPIPQDITGYRFHIIGSMTLKQFLQVAGGVVLAVIIYSTNLFAIIKWPLIGMSIAIGTMMAFVPFEERPLDHWLMTFIRILYKPTKFFWRKEPQIPDFFLFELNSTVQTQQMEIDLNPARRQRIKEYLQTVNAPDALDEEELWRQQQTEYLMAMFGDASIMSGTVSNKAQKPNLKIRVRSMRLNEAGDGSNTEEKDRILKVAFDESMPEQNRENYLTYRNPLDTAQVAQDIVVPEVDTLSLDQTVNLEDKEKEIAVAQEERAYTDLASPQEAVSTSFAATHNVDLPFPSLPTEPNKLVGMVLTPSDDLVNDAIVEIQTKAGKTIRAVKTNALGQFFVTTPLENGEYVLVTEKDDFDFQPLTLSLVGEIVKPVEIRSVV